MLFSGGFFLTYFLPILLVAYWIVPVSFRNALLTIASLCFFAWGEPLFVFVLFGATVVNFLLSNRLSKSSLNKKKWLVGYVTFNLLILVLCKYASPIANEVTYWMFGAYSHDWWAKIPLPLGISFYAFHTISYGVDVYRGVNIPEKRFDNFVLYLFLFPHQLAGPIVIYSSIAAELTKRSFSLAQFYDGFVRFAIGLAKKVLLANGFLLLIQACDKQQLIASNSTLMWVEMLAYTFHIFFDFAGYSDMAIGLGKMFGFHFPENFDRPYTSLSITEFWQRWHKSLGTFMRNYLYIPLGGNRVEKWKVLRNLFVVFFLSGIWHGANVTFLCWGIFHGLWVIADRLFLKKYLDKLGLVAMLFTFVLVLHSWVFFHEPTISKALESFQSLWSFDWGTWLPTGNETYFQLLFLAGLILIVVEYVRSKYGTFGWFAQKSTWKISLQFLWVGFLYLVSYSYLVAGTESPFIYYNF